MGALANTRAYVSGWFLQPAVLTRCVVSVTSSSSHLALHQSLKSAQSYSMACILSIRIYLILTCLAGPDYSHITLVSDGVSSVVSDDEISDIARGASTPKQAADRIISFASDMASQDNLTAIVVPLAGWGRITGPDRTKAYRERKLTDMIGAERLQRM